MTITIDRELPNLTQDILNCLHLTTFSPGYQIKVKGVTLQTYPQQEETELIRVSHVRNWEDLWIDGPFWLNPQVAPIVIEG